MPRFWKEVQRFEVHPLDDPGYEDLWGIYDFYKCDWAVSFYGDRYQSLDIEVMQDIASRLNEEEDNRYDHSKKKGVNDDNP